MEFRRNYINLWRSTICYRQISNRKTIVDFAVQLKENLVFRFYVWVDTTKDRPVFFLGIWNRGYWIKF